MVTDNCPKCHGSLHIRTKKGWARCSCSQSVTNSLYIKANIRCGETSYPPSFNNFSPLPLKDISVNGEYHDFRYMVWRSLVHYESSDLSYEFFDAYRTVEIYLGQDPIYTRTRDLESVQLVVVALGVSDLPNRMLAPLMCQLLTQRKMIGSPTWVYTSKTGNALRQVYDNTLVDLLGTVYPSVYDVVKDPKGLSPRNRFIET